MRCSRQACIAALLWLAACAGPSAPPATDLRLPALFSDHMVLQRDTPVAVWGWGSPGGSVAIGFAGQRSETVVRQDGTWQINLASMAAGGPYELSVAGAETLSVSDVMVGDVWLAAGQSNMEWPVERAAGAAAAIQAASAPTLRLFKVKRALDVVPRRDVESTGWMPAAPETVTGFSAVAYYFGRALHDHFDVPIGLIESAWGGTPAEAWCSADALAPLPDFRKVVEALQADPEAVASDLAALVPSYEQRFAAWLESVAALDAGTRQGWAAATYDASSWPTMALPAPWEQVELPDYDGVVWFRRAFELPAAWLGRELTLHLGRIDDRDTTWINGVEVGASSSYWARRIYRVPPAVLRPGRNVVAVRVLDMGVRGGFWGEADDMYLALTDPAAASVPLSLAGAWIYHPTVDLGDGDHRPPPRETPEKHPTVLFNGMIAPLAPYAVRGIIWYQGENNASRAEQYRTLFPALIDGWRRHWGRRDLPFLFVQLPNYLTPQDDPVEHESWPELREAQLMALALPATAMAVAIDIGDAYDIHPANKQEVGWRLALAARALVYDEDVVGSGPIYRAMSVEDGAIKLAFDHVGGGLVARGDALRGFAIAGADRRFVWADARIEGDGIVVSSPSVRRPVAVRYAWASNPIVSLYNAQGLPAAPFRTDAWPAPERSASRR